MSLQATAPGPMVDVIEEDVNVDSVAGSVVELSSAAKEAREDLEWDMKAVFQEYKVSIQGLPAAID